MSDHFITQPYVRYCFRTGIKAMYLVRYTDPEPSKRIKHPLHMAKPCCERIAKEFCAELAARGIKYEVAEIRYRPEYVQKYEMRNAA